MKSFNLTKALSNIRLLVGWDNSNEGSSNEISTEKSLFELIERADLVGREMRRDHEKTWHINAAYATGRHHVTWNERTRQIEDMEFPDWMFNISTNLVGPALLRDQAKVLRLRPKPEVIPMEDTHKKKKSARKCHDIITAKYESTNTEELMARLILTAQIFNKGFLKVYYDPKAGGISLKDQDGTFHKGDVVMDIDNPTTVFYEPDCGGIEKATWALSVKMKTKGWAVDEFPEYEDEICKSGKKKDPSGIIDRIKSILGWKSDEGETSSAYCVVREFWLEPKPEAKDEWRKAGCFLIFVNDVLVRGPMEFPYKNGKLPWVEMNDGFMQGLSEHGPTKTAQLIPSVNCYERIESLMYRGIEATVKQAILLPKGCQIDEAQITHKPGLIIPYRENENKAKPEYMRIPDPNHHSYSVLSQMMAADFENISGQHEVSRGISPSADSSGRAIEALQFADDTMIKPLADQYRNCLKEMYIRQLELYKQFTKNGESREIIVYGKRGTSPRVVGFKGEDLEWRDIRIEPTSMKPTSPWAMRQYILDLLDRGAFGPFETEEQKKAIYKAVQSLEFGSLNIMFEETTADDERAELENDILDQVTEITTEFIDENDPALGTEELPVFPEGVAPVVPTIYDNDEIHIERHETRMKQPDFLYLPKAAQLAHLHHLEEHKHNIVVKSQHMQQIMSKLVANGAIAPTDPQMAAMGMPEQNIEAAIGSSTPQPPMPGESPQEQGPPPGMVAEN